MYKIFLALSLCLFSSMVLACTNVSTNRSGPQEATEPLSVLDAGYAYEVDECPFELWESEKIDCGYLLVPEDRTQPDGVMIELAIAILKSDSDQPKSDPILYLEGGPGGSALVAVDSWLDSPLLEERDIILLDQRGAGFSIPTLQCPELYEYDDNLEAMAACRDRLEAEGVNLAAYNSANSAADINDLRAALNIDEWNLLGISYGTRLALTVMRDYPVGIRSVILDSVYPPNVDAYTEEPRNNADAIQALLDGCAADDACHGAYPELSRTFYQLLAGLDNEPTELDGEAFYGADFVDFMVNALYATETIPSLPMVIYEASQENYAPLLELMGDGEEESFTRASAFQEDAENVSDGDGMFYSVECHEEIPFGDPEKAKSLVKSYPPELADTLLGNLENIYQTCQLWGAGQADSIEDLAVESAIPTLLLAGEYDPVTPPSWAELAAQSLEKHYLYTLPRAGHALMDAGDCPMAIIQEFLENPNQMPDGRCVNEAALPFETP